MILNQIKTVLLLGVLTAVLLWVGSLFGTQGLMFAGIFVLGMNFFTYFFSDKFVLMMYRAKEVKAGEHATLHSIVNELAKEAQIPRPKIYIIETETPNAFATGRNPKHAAVAVTTGIMRILSKEELRGVIAHELSHVKNRDILIATIAATIAGVISYVAMMARFAAIFGNGNDREGGNNLVGLLVLSILTPLIATIIQLAISRSREYLADESGAKLSKDPKALASALLKIEHEVKRRPLLFGSQATASLFITNPFSMKGLFTLFSTHPPTEERVKRLNALA